ncbi:DUF4124 domain-containing protein [Stenotrophomonas sp. YIM B06876]|uniref:DUF4124 domain-containing protein n=1 Tax=Stenotrophomonas sp. YIM B06876 TaxID=3060211 RepID=UPI0027381AA6|nr:DUF4124 domain-containing protein [Stenotrophomonas sp. YIM B06876]
MRRWLLGAVLLVTGPLPAAEIVFYRCTDASGALTVQNMPCPRGTQQTRKVMQAVDAPSPVAALPQPMPASVPATPPAAEAVPAPIPAVIPAKEPVPLPPLFQCRTREGESYLSETGEPPSRCIAMRVTGLDGNPGTGAGDACEVVRNICTPVTPALLCETWRQRVKDVESEWRFASSTRAETLRRDYQRLQSLLNDSDCATQNP